MTEKIKTIDPSAGIAGPAAEAANIAAHESVAPTEALRLAGTIDAGSLALEHSVEAPAEVATPSKLRRGRRMLATVFSTLEARGLSPVKLKDDLKFGFDLVTTDPHEQGEAAYISRKEAAPRPEVRRA